MPSIALEQEVITTALVILFYTLLMYTNTNTARSTKVEQRLCSEALTSEVGLLQNFHAYKK